MNIEWHSSPQGKKVLHLIGQFDFSCRKDFMGMLKRYVSDQGVQFFDLDLSGITHLDTAGLGMLLLLRKRLGVTGKEIALVNCSSIARQTLYFSRFDSLFRIE